MFYNSKMAYYWSSRYIQYVPVLLAMSLVLHTHYTVMFVLIVVGPPTISFK